MAIISFKHKFIFIKTKKVAGTSVEAILRRFTGDEDIVPCVTPRDELYSALEGYYSKNYARDSADEEKYTRLVLEEDFSGAMEWLKNMEKEYVSHMTAERIRGIVESRGYSYADFYKFTIDRNPYSWVISSACYNNARYNEGTLRAPSKEEMLTLVKRRLNDPAFLRSTNWDMYTIDGEIAVNKILKFEQLEKDLAEALASIGLDVSSVKLPELKTNVRHLDPLEILDSGAIQKINKRFANTFGDLNYETR